MLLKEGGHKFEEGDFFQENNSIELQLDLGWERSNLICSSPSPTGQSGADLLN